MHTIIPAMLRRGRAPDMPFGVMGGAYQPTGHARLVTNIVDYGMDPQAAIDAPAQLPRRRRPEARDAAIPTRSRPIWRRWATGS